MSIIKKSQQDELLFKVPTKDDYAIMNSFFNDTFYQYMSSTKLHYDYSSEQRFTYAVTKDQQLIGYVEGYYPISDQHLWIQILAVTPPYLKQGYGRRIVSQLVCEILKIGEIHSIFLTCHKNNAVGVSFWKSLGFKSKQQIKSTHHLLESNLRSLTCIPNHLIP